jgi:hypothetical protein
MQPIIEPVSRELLESELNRDRFVRDTNNGNNEIYIITHYNSPHVMREIGRLREVTFRAAGGGTGLDCDLDEYDTHGTVYRQLIVWNPEDREIVGGYRFIECGTVDRDENGLFRMATSELFKFSDKFVSDYMPHTIELGRSFVQPRYQPSSENRKGLFSLDNLWDGLGAIVMDYPHIRYFFGKVTMYSHFDSLARDYILSFMNYFFPDREQLVSPIKSLPVKNDVSDFLRQIEGQEYKEAHRILNQHVRERGENIPPLFNSYMNLSATMKTFGTALNDHFGEVEETGIMVTIADIYDTKKERHITSYTPKAKR